MTNHVVISGLGAISALGATAREFWAALSKGRSAIAPLVGIGKGTRISMGAQVLNFEPQQHFASDELPLLDRYLQFAVVAAREALLDAGLGSEMINNAAAIIGTGCGGKHTDEASDDILYKQQRSRAHPLTIPKGMPSAAASMVSMLLGIRGPAFPFTSVRASGTHATVQI